MTAPAPSAAIRQTRRPAPGRRAREFPTPLAEDSPVVQMAVRAFLAGLLMADALEPFRDR